MRALGWIGLIAVAGVGLGAPLAGPTAPEKTLASLTAEIEALSPPKLTWRAIAWRKCLLQGLREAREQQKPVLLWAFINADPQEERC